MDETSFQTSLGGDKDSVLYAERLRDGRLALGTRTRRDDGEWRPGEMHVLEIPEYLALAGWFSGAVEDAWAETLREREAGQLQTAEDLYGEGPGAADRLALETLREIPPGLLARALVLMINSIGPAARQRLVARLNRTGDRSEEEILRSRLAEEREVFGYGVAAAALFAALSRNFADPVPDGY